MLTQPGNRRKLLLIRHAKSSWKFPQLHDHDRPLNRRGERDSLTMARHLAEQDEALDVIFSSTAIRALDFAQLLSEFSGVSLVPDLSFYTFDADELLELLRNLPDSALRVAIVGHNPAITRVVNQLTRAALTNVPTAGIVAIDCMMESWGEIGESAENSQMAWYYTPKILRHAR
ncbi:MAG: hypothetical protein HKN85_01260 [Gammaproteobacteria bacterium]|nr:hypothetical protein [Gammaproteobacteria bacterium]